MAGSAPSSRVDLPVGEDVPVVFNHTFTTPGDHLVEMPIDNDPLPLDDRRWLAVPVRESLNVLLVDGHFKTEPFQAETDYLAQALTPAEGSPGQPGTIRVGGRRRVAARAPRTGELSTPWRSATSPSSARPRSRRSRTTSSKAGA